MDVTASHNALAAERLGELAARYQDAWNQHRDDPQAVDIAAFLPAPGDPLRIPALLMLVPLDLAEAWRNGVPISLEDYIQRFPELGPLDRVPPELIAEEYRIRAQFGLISPHSVLKMRFPDQYDAVEKLIQSNPGKLPAQTIVPRAEPPIDLRMTANLVVGDHYQLNRLIGRGGFGEVWHGTDLRGGIDKAIKILSRSADSEEAHKEFEALNIVKKINHPCLLRTESYFVEKDRLFIVLELADATLRDVLKTSQTQSHTGIPCAELLKYMKHAAEGLDFLHKQGILHRDIKPENILVCGDYGKVADFGLAKTAMNKQSTQADFAGTVVYSAPETWDGRVTTRSDQYSLAATYFELRTGRVLFSGKTFQEVFSKHMQARADLEPLPDLEQEVLRRALSKKPEDRYPTCCDFVRALEGAALASGSQVIDSQPPRPQAPETAKINAQTTAEAEAVRTGEGANVKRWNEPSGNLKKRSPLPGLAIAALVVLSIGVGGVVFFDRSKGAGDVADIRRPEPTPKELPEIPPPVILAKVDPSKVEPSTVEPSTVEPKVIDVKVVEPKVEPKIEPKVQPPPLSEGRKKLTAAQALFVAKKYDETLRGLHDIDLANDADADLLHDGHALYGKLLRDGALDRKQLRSINGSTVEAAKLEPAFAMAMSRALTSEGHPWPADSAAWQQLLDDCGRADLKQPSIAAMQVEAQVELLKRASDPVPAEANDAFGTYVRARVAASEGKLAEAADLIVSLPVKAVMALSGPRALRAGLIVQSAATQLTPEKDGRLELFATVKDADRAFAWHRTALQIFGDPALEEQPKKLTWQDRLNAALAAACKSEPDFAACKAIGQRLLDDGEFAKSKSAVDLALADPADFRAEFAAATPTLSSADLAPMLRLGAAQLQENPSQSGLRWRQAKLSYTHARILDRSAKIEPAKILEADAAALALEPDNRDYQTAAARDRALVALAKVHALPEDDAAGKVKTSETALEESAAAFRPGSGAELWSDLGRLRALFYYTVGRYSDWKTAESQQAFANAVVTAKRALTAAPPTTQAELEYALGQSYEALALLCRIDVEKNFDEAAKAYEKAAGGQPRYAFQRARCLYRWATDGDLKYAKAKKDPLFKSAMTAFEMFAAVKDAADAAEAGYWEGLSHWDRIARLTPSTHAQKAFERSLSAAAKGGASDRVWAKYALSGLVDMTRLQAKGSPETSSDWLAAVFPAWKSLSKDDGLVSDPEFDSAGKQYRDLLAETSAAGAIRALKVNNLAKYRVYLDRAFEAHHTSRHAELSVERALGYKRHAAAFNLTDDELAAVRQSAIAAINAAPAEAARTLRKELDAGWGQ